MPNETLKHYSMKNQSEKIESIQLELVELEKMYHTITDMAAEHFNPSNIEQSIQTQILKLRSDLMEAEIDQAEYEAEMALEASQEFDKYEKD